jgi:hypothetical protein
MSDPELQQLLRAYASEAYALKIAIAEADRTLLAMRRRLHWLQEECVRARAKSVFVGEVVR